MNGIVTEAVYPSLQKDLDNMPIRTFYFDGTQGDLERDVGIFIELARTYQRRKKKPRRFPAYFSLTDAPRLGRSAAARVGRREVPKTRTASRSMPWRLGAGPRSGRPSVEPIATGGSRARVGECPVELEVAASASRSSAHTRGCDRGRRPRESR